ncbi:carbohydrate kinase family protein [Desmospora profundinema]|uniref:Fructokinase n=1 Tax=Desmospora profundinema TaxID=1571184 RepID=A0ABU1IRM7_9BACL|nr:carbohydrate kinase [Desmospora profundinema]MDR6227450.1 fructokinase [Desmospora profundinema]
MIPLFTLGEALIDFIPTDRDVPLTEAATFSRQAGGAPANVAAQAARLGGDARFIGKIGNDSFGDFLIRVLKDSGVDTTHVLQTGEARTSLAFVSQVEEDENPFTFYRDPAADQLLQPEEVPGESLTNPGIFHFCSVSLSSDPVRSATRRAVDTARRHGLLISFDPNIRPPLWPSLDAAKAEIRSLLPSAHLVKVSRSELMELMDTRSDDVEAIGRRFLEQYENQLLIFTLGSQGCLFVTSEGTGMVQAPAAHSVDPTGAGDSLAGAMLFRLSEQNVTPQKLAQWCNQHSWVEENLRFAVRIATHSTTGYGAIASYAGKADLARLGLE